MNDFIGMLFYNSKPVVATEQVAEELGMGTLLDIWHRYLTWRTEVMPTLKKEEQLFALTIDGKRIWVIEDPHVFTILYPEEY